MNLFKFQLFKNEAKNKSNVITLQLLKIKDEPQLSNIYQFSILYLISLMKSIQKNLAVNSFDLWSSLSGMTLLILQVVHKSVIL